MVVTRRILKAALTLLLLASLLSCGGCGSPVNTTVVTGSVVFDGKPVYPGTVLAQPESGNLISANLTPDGKFKLTGMASTSYKVAIQTQKLANTGRARSARDAGSDSSPKRREDKVPEKFKNANVDIPENFRSIASTPIRWDFQNEIPSEDVAVDLNQF